MNNSDKDADLFDEMVIGDKDPVAPQPENTSDSESLHKQTNAQAVSQEQMQNDSIMQETISDFENFRMPIAVDISNDYENQMRIDITNSLPDEAKLEMIRLQMEAAREQMEMESAEFNFDAPVENTGELNPPSIEPPVSQQLRK